MHVVYPVLMDVNGLQRIDRWVGVPACFLLTLVRKLSTPQPPDYSQLPKSLLVIKLAEQGSTVLAYSALKLAVDTVGRDNLYFAVFEENRFILDALDIVPEANVITISTRSPGALLRTTLAAVRRLRRLNLDAAVDLEFFSRGSAILAALSGARRRAGFHAFFGGGPYRGDLMTHRLVHNSQIHTTSTFVSIIAAALRNPEMLPAILPSAHIESCELPQFSPGADETERVRKLLHSATGGSARLILLNPNAGDLLPLRRWPVERYLELAQKLLAEYPDSFIAVTGAPREEKATLELVRRVNSPRCISIAGKTTLRELLILFTVSDILVTNDSGPAHFAALTPIHVVTLFGPETPALFSSRSPRHTWLWAGLPCSPCVNAYNSRRSACRNNVCMQSISVDEVFAAVRTALA